MSDWLVPCAGSPEIEFESLHVGKGRVKCQFYTQELPNRVLARDCFSDLPTKLKDRSEAGTWFCQQNITGTMLVSW